MIKENLNCLDCKFSDFLPADIQGVLNIGTVVNIDTDYLVTICDRNHNLLISKRVKSGAAGELSITFDPDDAGYFHNYFACGFPLTARNLVTGEIETIEATNGLTADCIDLQFMPCDDREAPFDLTLFAPKTCNCEPGCACLENTI